MTGIVRARHATVLMAAVAAVWVLFADRVVPVDLLVFRDAARSITHGLSPYVDPSAPALWSGHAFVYPYVTAWWFVPFAVLPTWVAGVSFFVLSVAALAVSARLLSGPGRGVAPVLVATTAEPVVRGLQLGTVNALLLLGVALAWRFRDRALVVIAAVTAVVVMKLFLAPMLAWLVMTRRWRPAAGVALASTAAIVVGCWCVHLPVLSYVRMLSVLSAHEGPHSSSVTAVLLTWDASQAWATVAAWTVALAIIAAAAWTYRHTRQERIVFCACVVASLVASPIVWSHYFTLLVAVPLILRWRAAYLYGAIACSWLIGAPVGAGVLRHLHPFPGSGYLWAALLAAATVLTVRRVDAVRAR